MHSLLICLQSGLNLNLSNRLLTGLDHCASYVEAIMCSTIIGQVLYKCIQRKCHQQCDFSIANTSHVVKPRLTFISCPHATHLGCAAAFIGCAQIPPHSTSLTDVKGIIYANGISRVILAIHCCACIKGRSGSGAGRGAL